MPRDRAMELEMGRGLGKRFGGQTPLTSCAARFLVLETPIQLSNCPAARTFSPTMKHSKIQFVLPLLLAMVLSHSTAKAADGPIDQLKEWLAKPREQRSELPAAIATAPLTKDQAADAQKLLWDDHVAMIKETRQKEWDDKAITIGDHTMKLLEKHFGEKPEHGWNLFISLHGGGNDPTGKINDSQWQNQIRLPYDPENSLYIAPRAPTNTWDLWHQSHMDGLFDRLIEDAIVLGDVDPNHIYVMGYSAGGDGVYRLATRMTDRWAAAAMSAGHPGDVSPLSLRNIGFALHVGGLDAAYNRNKIGAEWKDKLDKLEQEDPEGYKHQVQVHEGKPHWMQMEDKVAVPWMEKFTRNPIPDKVVWLQGDKPHDRSYWLATPEKQAKKGQLIVATRKGQVIDIEKTEKVKTVTVMLNDAMLDLDKPVVIKVAGKEVFSGVIPRTVEELNATLTERGDPDLVFSASKTINIE